MKFLIFFVFLLGKVISFDFVSQDNNFAKNVCDPSLLNVTLATKLAEIGIEGLQRKYPNIIHHVMNSDLDALPPHNLTPSFYGCYDWHSAVHTTWQMVRLLRTFPDSHFADLLRTTLSSILTQEKLLLEAQYLDGEGRGGFERPYGLAWLLQLISELVEWNDPQGNLWRNYLIPLESRALVSLTTWLPKLTHPIRIGEHSQTAFAMGLIFDYSQIVGDKTLEDLIIQRSLSFHLSDKNCPLNMEPSGHDFLSPCIGSGDLMRRVLSPEEFSEYLSELLPIIPPVSDGGKWLPIVRASDPSDGKLAHFDGLNLSRAWMLEGIASVLSEDDSRQISIREAIENHRKAGMDVVMGDMDYMGSHWLGSFAVYLSTCRGLSFKIKNII